FIGFFYCFKYLVDYLGDDSVPVSFNGCLSSPRKGDTVQSGGKPIISATNRGLSWKLFPVRAKKSGRLFFCGIFPRFFRFSSEGAPFQSRAVGVGITCPSASHCRIDSSRLFPSVFSSSVLSGIGSGSIP
ncbi:hypothetical protein, partial [Bacteroides thetaiotaomicron]|uniref:hypothetical protein n=1 Tax=Bacteroides thetaiotaomicron TaxID=818 RepID=UPI0034A38EB9